MEQISSASYDWLALQGQVCVVTGGGGGIGEEAARELARAGALVAVLDMNGENAEKVASDISDLGGQAIGRRVDISSMDQVNAAALEVTRAFGPCDVLVNNAATQLTGPLLDIGLHEWQRAIDVNLTGALVCTKGFSAGMMHNHRGSIINVASICSFFPRPNGGAYSASKAGLSMISAQMAVEFADHNVRCNAVAPGFVKTPLSAKNYATPEAEKKRADMVPSRRIGLPQDLANVIAFLASARSDYVNGQTILVDGGLGQSLMALVGR
ncbi:3-beta-hydroxysteroid dehydrogenase [Caballeronia calidae]|uniref:3-beta-hydroxysteroid dehydrogenase n=1 Tax=Caballeronia calidae TaxID=1777139 RepID=A0A158A844_9BURK|nr:glucose 1-dehydrogenase [Caballeronia calidae]SAK54004.1 3-beta-hydroxysteroid dehydrogenase [Caballeronia calidae]